MSRPKRGVSAAQRFYSLVRLPAAPDECLEWQGYRQRLGYGRFRVNGRKVLAHRYAYELLVGPIPVGLSLDHLCRNPPCVSPAHLEPVTHQENCLRGTSPFADNARKETCTKGHPYDEANTLVDTYGRRVCRVCRREWQRASNRRRRAVTGSF